MSLAPRRMLPVLAAIVVLILLQPLLVAQAQGPADPGDLALLDEFFAGQIETLHIPGLTFVLVRDGEVVSIKGYGQAQVEDTVLMNPEETVMRIGSVSKLFVATAVMQLVEQGELDLHVDINQYLERFRFRDRYAEPVTRAHLLTHTAGFGDHWSSTTDPDEVQPLGDYLRRHMPPRFVAPGELISYSNHGYALAAYVVEAVSGLPFDRCVHDRILQPLGMARSGYLLDTDLPEGLATGYDYRDGVYQPQPVHHSDDYPAGEMVSTAADMARFMIAHLRGGCHRERCILRPETVAEMQRQQFTHHPELPGWTYGFQEECLRGQRAIGHSGATLGFSSDLLLIPEHGLGYFVSFNHESYGATAKMLGELEELFMERFFPDDLPAPVPYPGVDAARLAGQYRYTRHYRHTVQKITIVDAETTVTARGERLLLREDEYLPIGPQLFQEVRRKRRIAFREDERGRITHMFWGPYAYERLAWYESAALHSFLFESTGWVWGGIAALGPLVALLRSRRGKRREPRLVRRAYWAIVAMAVLNAGFLLSLDGLFWRGPDTQRALLVLPLISTALGAGGLVLSAAMWGQRSGSLWGRFYYTFVALAAGLFAWFLSYWNFLGFHLG
ncbi:MAG TPA: serine hydrolase [Anaerolineae bacterium]|nr:serine hydrolase [Anaerolineae bacterium]